MLMPKKTKFRKSHKRLRTGNSKRGNTLEFGKFGIKAVTASWVDSRQIEAARRALTRYIKRGGKVWIRVFPDQPITKKPNETRMGSGKGSPDHFIFQVRPGRIIFEMDGISEELAREALRLGSHKLPLKTKFVTRDGEEGKVEDED
ncbi:MAG: 50S ribosomal protein L16 [Patescibacteria group bacterium]|nr:50S ribosomal protein L16 [Patescibacteria group bacterium]